MGWINWVIYVHILNGTRVLCSLNWVCVIKHSIGCKKKKSPKLSLQKGERSEITSSCMICKWHEMQRGVLSSSVTCWNDSLMFEVWFGLIMKPPRPRPSDLLDFKQLLSAPSQLMDPEPLKSHLCRRRRSSLIPSCSQTEPASNIRKLHFLIFKCGEWKMEMMNVMIVSAAAPRPEEPAHVSCDRAKNVLY